MQNLLGPVKRASGSMHAEHSAAAHLEPSPGAVVSVWPSAAERALEGMPTWSVCPPSCPVAAGLQNSRSRRAADRPPRFSLAAQKHSSAPAPQSLT